MAVCQDRLGIPCLLSQELDTISRVVGTPCLLSKRIERQVTCQPHELLGHRFEPFHQGLGFIKLAFRRLIFQFRLSPASGNANLRHQYLWIRCRAANLTMRLAYLPRQHGFAGANLT